MGYQPLEKLLPRSNFSVYKLILIAAKRATELADGAPRLIEFPSSSKTTTIALDEIMEGKIETREVSDIREKSEGKSKGKKKE